MQTLGRILPCLALLLTLPTGWAGPAHVARQADAALSTVSFRGIQAPDGRPLGDETQVECRVYDPKKPESTNVLAHGVGNGGAPTFELSLLNNTYTHETLNGCRCNLAIYGKGEVKWDVTGYVEFTFIDGTKASANFGKLKLGNGDGYKTKYDLLIDGL